MKALFYSSALAAALSVGACASSPDPRALHERILTLDTHLDTPAHFARPGWTITDRHTFPEDVSQVDLPRMIEGGLDGGFWVVYTPQGPRTPEGNARALAAASARLASIHSMIAANSGAFELALRSEDAARIASSGKRVVYISVENSYPLSGRLDLLPAWYDRGVRMIGPVHTANNDFADSATDRSGPQWNGLSPAGRELVRQANRLGMIVDLSHASDAAFDQALELSATPIILSHSGPSAVYMHPRNIDDERLRRLAAKGGVIQVNALGSYLRELPAAPERQAAVTALRARYGAVENLNAEQLAAYEAERIAIERQYPAPQADFEDYMRHLMHVLQLIGPDHVGIGADWDGGGGVAGMNDISQIPRITERLVAAGYSQEDIAKIWGGNVIRLLHTAEDYAATQGAR